MQNRHVTQICTGHCIKGSVLSCFNINFVFCDFTICDLSARILFVNKLSPVNLVRYIRAGEGRRAWATAISSSGPHISFFLFRQPWATTISHSVPPHLTLPGKTTFLNGIFRAFKVWFSKIQPRHAKKHTLTIFSILHKINILCVEFLNC